MAGDRKKRGFGRRSAPPREPNTAAPSARRLWTWALLLAAAGVAARAAWYAGHHADPAARLGPDGAVYLSQARDYLRGAIGDPALGRIANVYREFQAPGYPLFLAAIWKPLSRRDVLAERDYVVLAVLVTQWLLAAGATLMSFALARRVLFGFSALLVPIIVTASVGLAEMPNMYADETLLAFLLTATVLLLVKARENVRGAGAEPGPQPPDEAAAVAPARGEPPIEAAIPDDTEIDEDDFGTGDLPAGSEWDVLDEPPPKRRRRASAGMLVLGAATAVSYAILVQPRMALALPFVAAWLATALPWRYCAGFVLLALLLPAGWIARDYALYGEIVPLSIGGQAALYVDNVDPVGGDGVTPGAAPASCPRAELSGAAMADHIAWARCMQREGIKRIAGHPDRSAAAVGDRLAALLSPWNPAHARGAVDSGDWDYHRLLPAGTRASGSFKRADAVLSAVWIVAYALLAVIGLLSLWAEGPGSPARLIAIPLLSLPLAHLAFHAENRFRLPLLPLLSVALALGLVWLAENRSMRINR